MTDKNILDEAFPQYTQVGGNHYTKFPIQPYEFISKNDLSFFQGNVVKYVCRYQRKGGAEDIKKIIHYCQFFPLLIPQMLNLRFVFLTRSYFLAMNHLLLIYFLSHNNHQRIFLLYVNQVGVKYIWKV